MQKIIFNVFFFIFISSGVQAQTDTTFNQLNEEGQKSGWWLKTYPDGDTLYYGFFKEGRPQGEFVRYKEDQTRIVQYFKPGNDTVRTNVYYNNGKLAAQGKYVNKKKDSIWSYYSYYSGELTSEESYSNGELHGPKKTFYEEGQISEVKYFSDGVADGEWKQFFQSGKVKIKCAYQDGKMHGRYKAFYPNGVPYIVGRYKNGVKSGVWATYDEKGEVEKEIEYENGIPKDLDKFEKMEDDELERLEQQTPSIQDPENTPPFQ